MARHHLPACLTTQAVPSLSTRHCPNIKAGRHTVFSSSRLFGNMRILPDHSACSIFLLAEASPLVSSHGSKVTSESGHACHACNCAYWKKGPSCHAWKQNARAKLMCEHYSALQRFSVHFASRQRLALLKVPYGRWTTPWCSCCTTAGWVKHSSVRFAGSHSLTVLTDLMVLCGRWTIPRCFRSIMACHFQTTFRRWCAPCSSGSSGSMLTCTIPTSSMCARWERRPTSTPASGISCISPG